MPARSTFALDRLRARGVKGTTGTQASFLTLFAGDHAKVEELDRRVAEKLGFAGVLSGDRPDLPAQARRRDPRRARRDRRVGRKFGTDLRLLKSLGEMEEPFDDDQVGSRAMAYKRNPVRAERMCALSRHVIALVPEALTNAATQWLERSLDDSANRRLMLPEAFLAADAILILSARSSRACGSTGRSIARAVERELPFMATETLLMEGVLRGGDRQELHERVRAHSFEVKRRMHEQGEGNDLMARLGADPAVPFSSAELAAAMRPARLHRTGGGAGRSLPRGPGGAVPRIAPRRLRRGRAGSHGLAGGLAARSPDPFHGQSLTGQSPRAARGTPPRPPPPRPRPGWRRWSAREGRRWCARAGTRGR